jgi:hypothetical protein
MKKVKIMLLSLALFAVVGGALAFKAKIGNFNWCVTNAYSDLGGPGGAVRYYCAFLNGANVTTTTCGGHLVQNITTDIASGAIRKLCTTISDSEDPRCDKLCPVTTTTKID